MKNVLVGCEESQAVMIELRKRGINAFSCDLRPCSGGFPAYHLQMDVFAAIAGGELYTQDGTRIVIDMWHGAIFFPDCTYLTNSAEWAYKQPPYHQKVKPETLTGGARIQARTEAVDFVLKLWGCGIPKIGLENPIGVLSRVFMKPTQIIHPHMFGDDASKATCLWLKGLPALIPNNHIEPRIINGLKRWGNQTDSGQNRLSPSADRALLRSKTYEGIAKSMAAQWSELF